MINNEKLKMTPHIMISAANWSEITINLRLRILIFD